MTPAEQQAFVNAYGVNMAYSSDAEVADFVKRYCEGEDIDYSGDYTSIMDALGMWNCAIRWHLEQGMKA